MDTQRQRQRHATEGELINGDQEGDQEAAPVHLPPGGIGAGRYVVTGRRDRESNVIARAVREQWPIPEDVRPKAVACLEACLSDPSATYRDRVAAVKALATLNAQNMEARGERQSTTTTYNTVNILAAGEEAAKQLALLQGRDLPPPPNDASQG